MYNFNLVGLLVLNSITLYLIEAPQNYIYDFFFLFHGIFLFFIFFFIFLRKYVFAWAVSILYLYSYIGHLLFVNPFYKSLPNDVSIFVMGAANFPERINKISKNLFFNSDLDFKIIKNNPFNHSASLEAQFALMEIESTFPHIFNDSRYADLGVMYVLNTMQTLTKAYAESQSTYVLILEDDARITPYFDFYINQAISQLNADSSLDLMLLSSINFARPFWNLGKFQLFGLQAVLYRRMVIPYVIKIIKPGSPAFETALYNPTPFNLINTQWKKISNGKFLIGALPDFVISRICFTTRYLKCSSFPVITEDESI